MATRLNSHLCFCFRFRFCFRLLECVHFSDDLNRADESAAHQHGIECNAIQCNGSQTGPAGPCSAVSNLFRFRSFCSLPFRSVPLSVRSALLSFSSSFLSFPSHSKSRTFTFDRIIQYSLLENVTALLFPSLDCHSVICLCPSSACFDSHV